MVGLYLFKFNSINNRGMLYKEVNKVNKVKTYLRRELVD